MQYSDLDDFLARGSSALAKGPIAMIFVEDETEVDSTLRHHLDCGFKSVLALMPDAFSLAEDVAPRVERIGHTLPETQQFQDTVNKIIAAAPGLWMFYCFNTEYLFYPFCETRTVGEMLAFHTEERRDAMLAYVVDLYAGDLNRHPDAVALEDAHLDRSGYYALARTGGAHDHPMDRQLDFHGGLRWRYEEHIPEARRKIDRIAIFKAKQGLKVDFRHLFNDEEYNTYACPWHNNLTAAIASFRTAKALRRNPGSRYEIDSFRWHNSVRFEWHSRQFLDLGLMEPGQWF
ncbi:hypothetical protein DQW77_13940 [Roseovarius sp. TE539]|uniref:hypothetical protein n=1 Tax=Roseovarius sp. TE539 TaxID=2249812 RepID=UPI000DE1698F|nr:hypothetical protein [Roseovarius sp. TE539]RBI70545.1 hypothetical protein DQW77_13940 [Roseovarius sp. TE539]